MPIRLPGGVEVNVCVIEIKGLVYFDGLTPVGDWQKVARQVSNYVHKYKLVGTTLLLQRNGIGKTAVQTLLTKISSVDGEAGAASFAVSTYNSKTSILPQNQPNPFDCPVSDHENLRVEEIDFLTQQDEAAVDDLKMLKELEETAKPLFSKFCFPAEAIDLFGGWKGRLLAGVRASTSGASAGASAVHVAVLQWCAKPNRL